MRTTVDPRHLKRIKTMQDLFAWQFNQQTSPKTDTAKKIVENLNTIDNLISKAAPDRPLSQINKTDLAILRLAVFELIIEKKEPYKAIIDEAIELGKEFGAESSSAFINGSLGNLVAKKGFET